jgi:hypothetical protein
MLNGDLKTKFAEIDKQLISAGFKQEAVASAINDTDTYIMQHRGLNSIYGCKKCKMSCPTPVPGVGSTSSPIMIIGEG